MAAKAVSVSEAKATLSSIIQSVERDGTTYLVRHRGRPVARIMPLAGGAEHKAAGSLAKYANPSVNEEGAFAEEAVKKHAADR